MTRLGNGQDKLSTHRDDDCFFRSLIMARYRDRARQDLGKSGLKPISAPGKHDSKTGSPNSSQSFPSTDQQTTALHRYALW